MEEREGGPEEPAAEDPKARKARLAEGRARLKALDRRWASEGDSESLWEEEHSILGRLLGDGDERTVAKRARRARAALGPRGSAKDLADAALALWVLDRVDEAEPLLRAAIGRLPANRYPWDLLLRRVSYRGSPGDEIAFIEGQLDRVPWKGFALLQLGARHVDIAAGALVRKEAGECRGHLEAAKAALERARGERDTTDEMRRTADRLAALVSRLEGRLEAPDHTTESLALKRIFKESSRNLQLEEEVRSVADAAGVNIEGEVDKDLDLDELERIAMQESPTEAQERTVTVIRVTPVSKAGEDRKRKAAPPEGPDGGG